MRRFIIIILTILSNYPVCAQTPGRIPAGYVLGNPSTTEGAATGASPSSIMSPSNAIITISPTGTGGVVIAPTGSGGLAVDPTTLGTLDHMTIGSIAPAAATFTALTATGSTSLVALKTTGDALFQNGRPWCDVRSQGALGDGSTDDRVAIQACITLVQAFGTGGTIYFPPSTSVYCIKTSGGLFANSGALRFIGASRGVALSSCGVDQPILTITGGYVSVEYLTLYGKGVNNDTGTFGSNSATILVSGTSSVNCMLEHLTVWGGNIPLQFLNTADCHIEDVYAAYAYGVAVAQVQGSSALSGESFVRDKFDQSWPVSLPTAGASFNAWASSHAYSGAGTVVANNNYYMQLVSSSCTSGIGAPTLKNYGIAIPDGTCSWQLVGPTNYSAIVLDTGASENSFFIVDMTGSYSAGVTTSNSLSGTAPSLNHFIDCIAGQGIGFGVNNASGVGLSWDGGEVGLPRASTGVGIFTSGSDVTITNTHIFGASAYGIEDPSGVGTIISNNKVYGATSAGIYLGATSAQSVVTSNLAGSSVTYGTNTLGIQSISGAASCMILGNSTAGATTGITNSATCATSGNN